MTRNCGRTDTNSVSSAHPILFSAISDNLAPECSLVRATRRFSDETRADVDVDVDASSRLHLGRQHDRRRFGAGVHQPGA